MSGINGNAITRQRKCIGMTGHLFIVGPNEQAVDLPPGEAFQFFELHKSLLLSKGTVGKKRGYRRQLLGVNRHLALSPTIEQVKRIAPKLHVTVERTPEIKIRIEPVPAIGNALGLQQTVNTP